LLERLHLRQYMREKLKNRVLDTPSVIDRSLSIVEFEDMMISSNPDVDWRFDDRTYTEAYSPEIMTQVFLNAMWAPPVSPSVITHYSSDDDSLLVCLKQKISKERISSASWHPNIEAKKTFKYWFETIFPIKEALAAKEKDATVHEQRPLTARGISQSTSQVIPSGKVNKDKEKEKEKDSPPQTEREKDPSEEIKISALLSDPSSVMSYDVEEAKIQLQEGFSLVYPHDGSIVSVSTMKGGINSESKIVVKSIMGDVLSLHSPLSSANPSGGTSNPSRNLCSFTCSFDDGLILWIGRNGGLSQQKGNCSDCCSSLKMEISTPDGLHLSISMQGRVEQYFPPFANKNSAWGITGEKSRSIFGKGTVAKYTEDGITLYLNNGCTAEYDSESGNWMTTNERGERKVRQKDGKICHLRPINVVKVVDPETRQTIITREDMVLSVFDPSGEISSKFPDGTMISTNAEGSTTVRAPGFATTTCVNGLVNVAIPGGVVSFNKTSLRLALENGCKIGVTPDEVVSYLPAKLIEDRAEAARRAIQGAQDSYLINLKAGVLETPDYEKSRFVVSLDGTVKMEAKADEVSSATQKLPKQTKEKEKEKEDKDSDDEDEDDENEDDGSENKDSDNSSDEEADERDKNDSGVPAMLRLSPDRTHPPRLFVIKEDGSGVEFLPERITDAALDKIKQNVPLHFQKTSSLENQK